MFIIFSNVSLPYIFIIFYVINLLYALTCTIEHIIYVEFATYNDTAQCLIPMGADFNPIAADSLSTKDDVFLSSNYTSSNNPSSNTGGTGGQVSRPSIFTNPCYIRPPEQAPVPVEGQGDNPTLFTIAKPGQPIRADNCYNTKDGVVNRCEYKKGANPKFVAPINKFNNGICYNCKIEITQKYHGCDSCARHMCDKCDSLFKNHVANTFADHIANLRIRLRVSVIYTATKTIVFLQLTCYEI